VIRSAAQLAADVLDELNEYDIDHIMINVAGRWTGIKSVTTDTDSDVILIETED
jgi:hypothetical protein